MELDSATEVEKRFVKGVVVMGSKDPLTLQLASDIGKLLKGKPTAICAAAINMVGMVITDDLIKLYREKAGTNGVPPSK
jgi:hypothetical protein